MPCPHLLNSLITSVLNSFAYELELKYTYVFKSTEICYRQLSAQWWCLQGFLLVMNKCFYWYGWELEGYICLWWKAWLENNLFWDRLLYKAKLWLCSSLFSWWAIVLKTQGLVSSERWGKIVRNKSRAIIHYQPLSSSLLLALILKRPLQAVPSNTMFLVYWERDKFEMINRGEQIGSHRSAVINLYICVRAQNKSSNDLTEGGTRKCICQSSVLSIVESVSGLSVLLKDIVNTQTVSLPVFKLLLAINKQYT